MNKIFGLYILLIMGNISCKKFVEIDPPVTQMVTTNIFDDNSTATAAQTVIYANMSSNSSYMLGISRNTGLSADEFISYSNASLDIDLYKNALNGTTDGDILQFWGTSYNYIYQENAIIEGLTGSTKIDPRVKQQLLGEAKFMRAFFYFNLINIYGDVPLITSTDYKVNSALNKTPKSQVFQQIISDLKEAQDLISSNYIDASSVTQTSERVRPTKWAVKALLARVYLYTNDWVNAEAESTDIINNSATFSLVGLNDVFLKNSQEAIWQLTPLIPGYNTQEGNAFILTAGPGVNADYISLSSQVLSAFESGDKRKDNWIGIDSSTGSKYYYPYKYKIKTGSAVNEYIMVMRLAEQYLIRSESRANQNKINEGLTDLNIIRSRSGLANTSAIDKVSLLSAIAHERQVELFSEGHRWFDLKRTQKVDGIMSLVTPLKGGAWKSYQQLYPIPFSDIQTSNLSQNDGY